MAKLAWAFVAFWIWRALPLRLKFVGFGWWLLPWAGFWGHHPMHDREGR